jgi:serine/threonine-protein kinase ULK2
MSDAVQRDLKPGNILLASQGAHVCVKIADFGFARALEPARLANTLCGSPLYMAPEVLSENAYDSRSDLWSVGVMMYEMLVGQVPFMGNNIVHLKKVIDSNEAFLPFDRRQQLSVACQVLCHRPPAPRRRPLQCLRECTEPNPPLDRTSLLEVWRDTLQRVVRS